MSGAMHGPEARPRIEAPSIIVIILEYIHMVLGERTKIYIRVEVGEQRRIRILMLA